MERKGENMTCHCGRELTRPEEPLVCSGCGMPDLHYACLMFCGVCNKPLGQMPLDQGNDLADHREWHREQERHRA